MLIYRGVVGGLLIGGSTHDVNDPGSIPGKAVSLG